MLKILKNQFGFSMVQIMVAAGLMGGLSLVLMKIMENQVKVKNTAEMDNELNMIIGTIYKATGNKDICEATFRGVSRDEYVSGIKMSATGTQFLAETGKVFKSTGIKINGIRILSSNEEKTEHPKHNNIIFDTETGNSTVYLKVSFEKLKDVYGAGEKFKYFPIAVTLGTTDILAMCMTTGVTKQDLLDKCTELMNQRKSQLGMNSNEKLYASSTSAGAINKVLDNQEWAGCGTTKAFLYTCVIAGPDSEIDSCIGAN